MKTFARIFLLLMIGGATGLLWIYCSAFLPHDLARGGASLVLADRCAGMLTVLVMMVAPAMPVQSLFPRHSVAAAFGIGWMPLVLALLSTDLFAEGILAAHGIGFSVTEGCINWIAIVLGAWTTSRLRGQQGTEAQGHRAADNPTQTEPHA